MAEIHRNRNDYESRKNVLDFKKYLHIPSSDETIKE